MQKFHGAVSADGADRSGLTHLTYAVMANYAVDAALAVALANTLFFAAAKADSTAKVLLYLLLTVAPFAVIAPLIGPCSTGSRPADGLPWPSHRSAGRCSRSRWRSSSTRG